MKQLKLGNVIRLIEALKNSGMKADDICKTPIYIGDDDEINGIHCAWDCVAINADSKDDDDRYIIEMINEGGNNIPLTKGSAVVIL